MLEHADLMLLVLSHLDILRSILLSMTCKAFKQSIDLIGRYHFAKALVFQLSPINVEMPEFSIRSWVRNSRQGNFNLEWNSTKNRWQTHHQIGMQTSLLPSWTLRKQAEWRYALYRNVLPRPKTVLNMHALVHIDKDSSKIVQGRLQYNSNVCKNASPSTDVHVLHVVKWQVVDVQPESMGSAMCPYAQMNKNEIRTNSVFKSRQHHCSNGLTFNDQKLVTLYLQAHAFETTSNITKVDNTVMLVLHNVPVCTHVSPRERVVFNTFRFCMSCGLRDVAWECLEACDKQHRLMCNVCLKTFYVEETQLSRSYLCSAHEIRALRKKELMDVFVARSMHTTHKTHISKQNLLVFFKCSSWTDFLKRKKSTALSSSSIAIEYRYKMTFYKSLADVKAQADVSR